MFPQTVNALKKRMMDLDRGLQAAIHALNFAEEHLDPGIATEMWAHCDGGLIGAPDIRTLVGIPAFPFDFEQFCTLLKTDPEFQDIEIQQPPSDDQAPCEVYFRVRDDEDSLYHTFSLYLDAVLNYTITLWSIGAAFESDIYQESVSLRDLPPENLLRLLKTWLASITA